MLGLTTKSLLHPLKICSSHLCRNLHTSYKIYMEPGASKNVDKTMGGQKHPLVPEYLMKVITLPKRFNPEWPQPKVVIIGAGMAGLSAADRLLQNGIVDFTILEALGRPGGRLHTCKLNSAKVDLGGDKILGANLSNAAFSLAVTENLHINTTKNRVNCPYYTTDGSIIYDVKKPYEILHGVFTQAAALFLRDKKINKSLRSYIQPLLDDAVSKLPEPQHSECIHVMNGMMNEIQIVWGDELANISADYFGSYIRIPSGDAKLKDGLKTLLDGMIEKTKDKLRYNKPVQNIRWDKRSCPYTNRGSVLCCDGEEIPCDYVICTVSLGVLKAQAETFFSPPLPDEKLQAIRNLSYGHVNFLFLEYETPFWSPDEGEIRVGWNPLHLQVRESWLKGIGNIQEVAKGILRISVGGREAILTESCSDSVLAEDATNFLRKLTGDPSIPCPINILRSRWSSDVYFLGARSFLGLNSSVDDQCILSYPLPAICEPPPIVLFAGEATTPGFFSTVHGARISGIREADRILQLSIAYKGPPCQIEKVCS